MSSNTIIQHQADAPMVTVQVDMHMLPSIVHNGSVSSVELGMEHVVSKIFGQEEVPRYTVTVYPGTLSNGSITVKLKVIRGHCWRGILLYFEYNFFLILFTVFIHLLSSS